MPFTYPSHEIKPTSIERCRFTHIIAEGRAKGNGNTATAAVKDALKNARVEIALAVADVLALRCPTHGGCGNGCRHRRTVRVGKGIDRNIPIKKGAGYEATAWGYESFEIQCYCPE